jgi:hypothetical protein
MSKRHRSPTRGGSSRRSGKVAKRGSRNSPEDEYASQKWNIDDLRALASLAIGGDFSKTGRAAIAARLVAKKVNASVFSEQAIAAHRDALAKSNKASPPSDADEDSDDEIDGVAIVPETASGLAELKEKIKLLEAQVQAKNIGGTALANTPTQGNDPILATTDKITKIEKIAQDFAVQKTSVSKAAEGNYTEVWELSRYSVHRQTQAATSSTPGQITLTTSTKKASLPQSFADWSSQIGVLEIIRQQFAVHGASSDRLYVDFFRDTIWVMFTPLGVATMDRHIRQNAASKAIAWWPIPADVLTMGLIFSLPHLQNPAFCQICGQVNHLDTLCPLSDALSPSIKHVTFAPAIPTNQPGTPNAAASPTVCPHFMRPGALGKCKPWKGKVCSFIHICPSCKGNKHHTKKCNR